MLSFLSSTSCSFVDCCQITCCEACMQWMSGGRQPRESNLYTNWCNTQCRAQRYGFWHLLITANPPDLPCSGSFIVMFAHVLAHTAELAMSKHLQSCNSVKRLLAPCCDQTGATTSLIAVCVAELAACSAYVAAHAQLILPVNLWLCNDMCKLHVHVVLS